MALKRLQMAAGMTTLMAASQVLNYFDRSVLAIAAVDIMRDLNLSPEQYGLLASAFYSVYAVSGIAVGLLLSHKVRPRVLLAWLIAAWTVLQMPIAFAPSFTVLIVCRAALGAAESPSIATAIAATHEWYPPERRNLPTAIVMTGPALGAILAPPILTALNVQFGWRTGFVCCALLSGLVLALILLFGRDGAASATAGTNRSTDAKPARIGLATWRDPTLIAITLVGCCSYWVGAFAIAWLLPMLRLALGFTPQTASWIVSGIYLANIVVLLVVSSFSQRLLRRGLGSRMAVVWPTAACLIAGSAFLLLSASGQSPTLTVLALLCGISLMLPVNGAVPVLVSEIAPPAERNRMLVVVMSATSLSGLLAPYVSGLLIKSGGLAGYSHALVVCAAVTLFGAILAWAGIRPKSTGPTSSPIASQSRT